MTAGSHNAAAATTGAAAAIDVKKPPVGQAAPRSGSAAGIDLEKLPLERVLTTLAVQADRGLSSAEAQKRLAQYGPNAIVEKEKSLLSKVIGKAGRAAHAPAVRALCGALLIVLQGIDAAGKDGTCWHVMSAMNPQGTTVTGFKQPTEEERAHDFLWRIHPHVPAGGQVAVFNRSHYEDVLVVRVHKLVPKDVWSPRFDLINDFERMLADHGTTIIKFSLYISPEEQLERFKQRLDDSHRQWKISDSDYKERKFWGDYIKAYEDMLETCSTKRAPSNQKWFRNLAVSQVVADTLDDLDMKMPKPSVDLDRVRQQYHAAVAEAPHHRSRTQVVNGRRHGA